ncbi:MAG TPA: DnaB-like helicase C-terminal domain-containing protein [Flexivirga sp.]|uniref:DnaB-like helicase C-terminal domain-containing protein n=1 Tax=Flexivirga sp. TaxID=1962927 RepID=UPI002C8216A4|nr:DnaB-like helicase C-terminal domain-containing protein [Flexivirga sp.]HWC22769.1 DnaB-like helicase C-terminal domain-containing protein [Flexivirga sp.]
MSHYGPRDAERLTSLGELIAETDATLRRGVPAGARVWPTGFRALDQALTGGIRSGELALIGGPHGQGKTTLAMQLARNVIASGGTAVVFSYEHEGHTLLERLISLEAATATLDGVPVTTVRRAFETAYDGAPLAELLSGLPGGPEALAALTSYGDRLSIHESSGATTTLAEIQRISHELAELQGQPPMIVVDYLQKVPLNAGYDDLQRVAAVTERLKDTALDLGAPVVAIAAAEGESLGAGRRMRAHDLRGSSSLAYEADVVLIISDKADIVSREHLVYDLGNAERFHAWSVVTLEKNRHGRDRLDLEFAKDFQHGRFDPDGRAVNERLIDDRVITS